MDRAGISLLCFIPLQVGGAARCIEVIRKYECMLNSTCIGIWILVGVNLEGFLTVSLGDLLCGCGPVDAEDGIPV